MITLSHAIVGAAIAQRVNDPFMAPALSFFSHFLLDSIPHWDFGTDWRLRPKWLTGFIAVTEMAGGLTVAYILFHNSVSGWILIPSLLAAIAPDILEAPWFMFFAKGDGETMNGKSLLPSLSFHIMKFENRFHTKSGFISGIFTQIATVAFFLLLLNTRI